ncbi:P-loop containing nucleoside triphosphate hydrolase protein [Hesseltinella vesiculosa]|uniref:P-loop containing nucleoside triphosphate hydrolase protein n=1 Tax=Hesseltinella vesiculosa TaxID=101127 RepID=A0A1X2GGC4_9FUNG|nr:P-loop containing nucleoside triphosphate hydrolase protein [Hesseltinella vesiculosa]
MVEGYSVLNTFQLLSTLLHRFVGESFMASWVGPQWISKFAWLIALLENEAMLMGISLTFGPALMKYLSNSYYRIENFITSRLYVTIEVDEMDIIHTPISKFISQEIKKLDIKEAQASYDHDANEDYNHRGNSSRAPAFQLHPLLNNQIKFKYKGKTFWINRVTGDEAGKVKSKMTNFERMIFGGEKVSFRVVTRGSNVRILKEYLALWMEDYYKSHADKLVVYKCVHDGKGACHWSENATKDARSLDTVILKQQLKENIVKDINYFLDHKEWYADKGIPYRHGFLLKGPPGTGKTSVVRSLASTLGKGLAVVNLTNITSDEELTAMVSTLPHDTFLLMEDVDHCLKVIEKAAATKPTDGALGPKNVTLPGLLSMLDGYDMRDGTVFFMTCNDESALPAVMKRRGRVDQEITLDYADEYQIVTMFERFFKSVYHGSDDTWQTICDRLKKCIPTGTIATAELQGLFLDFSFSLQREKITKAAFDDLLDNRIQPFLDQIKESREISQTDREQKLTFLTNRMLKKKKEDSNSDDD